MSPKPRIGNTKNTTAVEQPLSVADDGTVAAVVLEPGRLARIAQGGVLLGLLRTVEHHPDLRGSVAETYRESWFPEVPPIKQLVQSNSKAGVARGLHSHAHQWDIWRFVSDGARVVLYEPRSGALAAVAMDKHNVLAIPPGVAHGFYTESGCVLLYALTNEYDGSDESGFFMWDPEFPGRSFFPETATISQRDMRAPSLREYLA